MPFKICGLTCHYLTIIWSPRREDGSAFHTCLILSKFCTIKTWVAQGELPMKQKIGHWTVILCWHPGYIFYPSFHLVNYTTLAMHHWARVLFRSWSQPSQNKSAYCTRYFTNSFKDHAATMNMRIRSRYIIRYLRKKRKCIRGIICSLVLGTGYYLQAISNAFSVSMT